ncbi:4Fe-4S binding protein [bacterium]|nr:4Fe-4S binding protein [bacterium]
MSKIIVPSQEGGLLGRRGFLGHCLRGLGVVGLSGLTGLLVRGSEAGSTVWQIDPERCIGCGNCAKNCVLKPSAVKCVHEYKMCGYCELCFGYLADVRPGDTPGAGNERCPTGAISRSFVEQPYYQYTIDEQKCYGCGQCVKGCKAFGNNSLILQVRHDRCVNCNECAIARQCPAQAFVRVPAGRPYLLRTQNE